MVIINYYLQQPYILTFDSLVWDIINLYKEALYIYTHIYMSVSVCIPYIKTSMTPINLVTYYLMGNSILKTFRVTKNFHV